MRQVKINIAALCDTGGRKSNQDNIFLSCAGFLQSEQDAGHTVHAGTGMALPPEGTMLVVADGMGGMNVGDVASRLIVETFEQEVKSFKGQTINDMKKATGLARRAILNADSAIKQYVAAHPEAKGTGSTVVLLWLLGDKAVVAWCGDSRCYRFNPRRGLEQLSHDHSYVQQLVDEGKLPPEMAFGHDQSNIITRCLSDDAEPTNPDIKVVDVYRDDMFLLCSDGLCGLLPDEETGQLLLASDGDVRRALDNCWRRGADEGWSDNVSIILSCVDGVDAEAPERKVAPLPPRPTYTTVTVEPDASPVGAYPRVRPEMDFPVRPTPSRRRLRLVVILLLLVLCAAAWFFLRSNNIPLESTSSPVSENSADNGIYSPNKEHSSQPTVILHEDSATIIPEDTVTSNSPKEKTDSRVDLMQASEVK